LAEEGKTAMKVKFSGLLKTEVTGEWEIEVNACCVADLIDKLIKKYGHQFEEKVMADGKIRCNILLVVNGRLMSRVDVAEIASEESNLINRKVMETALKDDDVVSIFELVCG
jgi:molybdopterin converting factor small subunit